MNSKEQTERLQKLANRYEAFYRKSAELILAMPELTGYEPGPSLWTRVKRFLRTVSLWVTGDCGHAVKLGNGCETCRALERGEYKRALRDAQDKIDALQAEVDGRREHAKIAGVRIDELTAEVARLRGAMTMILSLMGDCGTERCTLVPKAKEIAAKALAEKMPVQTQSGEQE